jgi:hypothetical protein
MQNAPHINTTSAEPKNSKHLRSRLIDENRLWMNLSMSFRGKALGRQEGRGQSFQCDREDGEPENFILTKTAGHDETNPAIRALNQSFQLFYLE